MATRPAARERVFGLRARGTTVAAEVRGGAVAFVTMSYIVFVQPAVLSRHAGMDFGAVMAATCPPTPSPPSPSSPSSR